MRFRPRLTVPSHISNRVYARVVEQRMEAVHFKQVGSIMYCSQEGFDLLRKEAKPVPPTTVLLFSGTPLRIVDWLPYMQKKLRPCQKRWRAKQARLQQKADTDQWDRKLAELKRAFG